jgi:hypothetical protein
MHFPGVWRGGYGLHGVGGLLAGKGMFDASQPFSRGSVVVGP